MSSYARQRQEDRRLVILRLLSETPGFSSNSSILTDALDPFGHSVSRDTVETELAWLAEQGLAEIERIASVTRAALTARGHDVARGVAHVPGVKKPRPGE